MTLRLLEAPGGPFIYDGEVAVRLADITKIIDFPATEATPGMVKYEIRSGGFGYISAPLVDVLALIEMTEVEYVPPTDEEIRERRKAEAQRLDAIKYRSA